MSIKHPVYRALSLILNAYRSCQSESANESQRSYAPKHRERIEQIVKDHMPSGAGFDSGTTLDLDASTDEYLVFHTAFHHMGDTGSYCGWTEHKVTVRPSLGFKFFLAISGRDRNHIKDYIHEAFQTSLNVEVQS